MYLRSDAVAIKKNMAIVSGPVGCDHEDRQPASFRHRRTNSHAAVIGVEYKWIDRGSRPDEETPASTRGFERGGLVVSLSDADRADDQAGRWQPGSTERRA